jgi:multidrug/hemolysin transport system permease protein
MLIKRNLMLFFRDKANVFFSLLAVLIIIGLYVLFLGDLMEESLRSQVGYDSDKISVIMASIVLAGMVAVTSVTSCLGAMGIRIGDKEAAAKDFYTSPVSRGKITMSYALGSAAVGFIMTLAALGLSLGYIAFKGGILPDLTGFVLLLLTVVLSVLCGNAVIFFIAAFVRSRNAFASLSTVVGTLIGFLMGIYIPIGQLPGAVQWVIKCFPMTHAASMFRLILADGEVADLFAGSAGSPPEALDSFRESFGIVFNFGGVTSSFWFSAAVLAVTAIVFYAASLAVERVRRV